MLIIRNLNLISAQSWTCGEVLFYVSFLVGILRYLQPFTSFQGSFGFASPNLVSFLSDKCNISNSSAWKMPCNRRLLNFVFSPIKRVTAAQLTPPSDCFVAAVVSAFPKLCESFFREQSIETRSFDSFLLRLRQSSETVLSCSFVDSFCGFSHFGRANLRFLKVSFSISFGPTIVNGFELLYSGTNLVLFASLLKRTLFLSFW